MEKKVVILLFDLYWLRYKKPGKPWYELTDYLREKLVADYNYTISYDDKRKDLLINKMSLKKIFLNIIGTKI